MMHGTHNVTLTHSNMMHGTHNIKLNNDIFPLQGLQHFDYVRQWNYLMFQDLMDPKTAELDESKDGQTKGCVLS